MWCQTGEWQVFRWLVGLQTIETRGLTKHECVEKYCIVQQCFFETQGQCEPSNSRFNSMMDHCPFACSDGECPDPAGNDECQDDSLYCPREKYLVSSSFWSTHVSILCYPLCICILCMCRGNATSHLETSTQPFRTVSILAVTGDVPENLGMTSARTRSGPVQDGNIL